MEHGGIEHATQLCLLPAAFMLLGSCLVFVLVVPTKVMAAMQHLAAGIVSSAVAVEMMPIVMEAPNDTRTIVGISVGFMAGVGMLVGLSAVCEVEEPDEPDEGEEDTKGSPLLRQGSPGVRERSRSAPDEKRSRLSDGQGDGEGRPHPSTPVVGCSKLSTVRKMSQLGGKVPRYPVAMAVAVCVDALVDGFLIGLASGAGSDRANAGLVMTAALTIEMCFLGLTFGAAMRKQPLALGASSVVLPPALLLLGGVAGSIAIGAVASDPALHAALVAFGIAALLYLVTEELLLEAHHSQGQEEHIWWIDLLFFLGFLGSFLTEKMTA